MKCVVFGGGGFIGSAIVDKLLVGGHSVRVFERPRVTPYRLFSETEKVEWMTGDFLSIHDISSALEGMDTVIHLVSFTLPKTSNDDLIYDVQTNLIATIQLLNSMLAMKINKIVFISSGGTVYGVPRYIPIDEDHPTDPVVSYGITKLAIEKYLLMFRVLHRMKVLILRVANPYGPRQRVETAQGAVAAFFHRSLHNQKIEIWGDGSITRDYIYIDDVAEAFLRAVDYSGDLSVFNISSGIGTSLNELAELIGKSIGRQLDCTYLEKRPFDVPTSILNNNLAATHLGWVPKTVLQYGLAKTAEWLRNNSN
ncbi:MAG: NAD-dependent epimerase/dehydratase family protein [Anaerolineales bacterium]